MQRIILPLAATLIGAAFVAASPLPASASADHVKARHAKRIQARDKKAHGVLKKALRVAEPKSEATEPRAERKTAKGSQRVNEKANKTGHVQDKSAHRALHATAEDELAFSDTTNALVALAMRYDGKNPTGWSHNWCAHYLDVVLQEAGYPSGGNLARGYASYGQPTPARVGAIAVMPNHVGVVTFVGDDYVILVSGNHGGSSGHRTVGLGRYAMNRITTFRMPLTREVIVADEPKLVPAEG